MGAWLSRQCLSPNDFYYDARDPDDAEDVFYDFEYSEEYRCKLIDWRIALDSSSLSDSNCGESSMERGGRSLVISSPKECGKLAVNSADLEKPATAKLISLEDRPPMCRQPPIQPSPISSMRALRSQAPTTKGFTRARIQSSAISLMTAPPTIYGLEGKGSFHYCCSYMLNTELVRLYAQHPCLWNINHEDFMDRTAQAEAWCAVARTMKKRCVATVSPSFCRNRIFKLRQWESRHRLEKMRQMQHERRVNNGGRIWTSLFSEVLAREEGQKLICDSCVKSADIENNEVLICPMRNILMCCGGNKWWDRNDERALQIMSKEQSFRFLDKIFE